MPLSLFQTKIKSGRSGKVLRCLESSQIFAAFFIYFLVPLCCLHLPN